MRFYLILYWNEEDGYDIDGIDEFVGYHTKEDAKKAIEKYAAETPDFLPANWRGNRYESVHQTFEQRMEIRPVNIKRPVD